MEADSEMYKTFVENVKRLMLQSRNPGDGHCPIKSITLHPEFYAHLSAEGVKQGVHAFEGELRCAGILLLRGT